MDWVTTLSGVWHYLVLTLTILIAVLGSGHAILYKRDSRAAVLWVGFIWLAPLVGALLYFLLGVNRIRRRAALLRSEMDHIHVPPSASPVPPESIAEQLRKAPHLSRLARLMNSFASRPLLPGNRVEPLVNGDAAFPAMLEAIRHAKNSVSLASYIFDKDRTGCTFAEELGAAVRRGVEVRVLVDDAGARYSFPSIVPLLRRNNVRTARFLPTLVPFRMGSMNLRNHRKIMVVDGEIGFTGGMNIRHGNLLKEHPSHPVQDLHFQISGPVVNQLQEVFAEDWLFTTQEALRGPAWFPRLEAGGPVMARGISDGPDEDMDKLMLTLLGAISTAEHSIRILTPYFLPEPTLISALNLAAMRGVEVTILLPERSNLPFVHWATFAILWQLLERGCRVWLSPPPFDHSKLLIVDDHWSLIGSANLDPRSLRLNFEFNLECYDLELHQKLNHLIQERLRHSREITLKDVDARSLPVRLRDGIARLASPFL